MLLIDGVRYKLWTPIDEENQFSPMIKEHSKEIFGEQSLYFDARYVLKSESGIGSIPDAYVISLAVPSELYVIENELSSHQVYNHIVNQLTRFINGVKNQDTRNQIIDMIYDEINKDGIVKATVKKLIDTDDIHHFLSKLLSKEPRIIVIIDQKTRETEEACQTLNIKDIIEFKTFVRENAETVHAHLFEPIIQPARIVMPPVTIIHPPKPIAPPSTESKVFFIYKSKKYEGTFNITSKKITYNGKQYTPSRLSGEITQTSRNGWRDWKYIDEQGNERSINELR